MIALEKLLTLLPPGLLDRLALEHRVDAKNQVRLRGSTVFVCLLNGLLSHGDLTLRLLEEIYRQRMGCKADHSSFGKRLAAIKPAYFAAIFAFLHGRLAPQATPGEAKALNLGALNLGALNLGALNLGALRLRFVDATLVTLSAKLLSFGLSGGTRRGRADRRSVKSVVALEDGLPRLLRVCRDQPESSDCVALGDAMLAQTRPGDLWVFDKGMHDRTRLLALSEAGAFFVTPHKQQGLRVLRVLWRSEAPAPAAEPGAQDPPLVLVSAEQAVFENSRPDKRWAAMPLVLVHGLRFDARARQWVPLTLMTSLPASPDGLGAGPYTLAQITELYRRRWDIETLFKFLKQHLGYGHLTSRSENGIEVMIYASLIAALLLIWYKRETGLDRGWRSVKFWLAEDARRWTEEALRQDLTPSLQEPPPPVPPRLE